MTREQRRLELWKLARSADGWWKVAELYQTKCPEAKPVSGMPLSAKINAILRREFASQATSPRVHTRIIPNLSS